MVVPRHAFVQHPGREAEGGHLLSHPGLVDHHACDTLLGRAGQVTVGAAFEAGRHRQHAVRQAWQLAEVLRHGEIGALCDLAGFLAVSGCAHIEPRVFAHRRKKRLERTGETRLCNRLVHARPDALHFAFAERVNLGRCLRRRSVPTGEVRVVLLPLRHAADADFRSRGRQVFLLQELQQRLLGGTHPGMQDVAGLLLERRAPIRGKRLRHIAERGEQRRLVVRPGQLATHVRNGALDRARGLRQPGADATTHVLDLARVVGGKCLEPRDPGVRCRFVVERRVERGVVCRRVETIAADERHALLIERETIEREADAIDEQFAVECVVAGEAGSGKGLQPTLEVQVRCLARGNRGRRIVRPDARGLLVAALGCTNRILRTVERVEILDDRSDAVGIGRGIGRVGRLESHE